MTLEQRLADALTAIDRIVAKERTEYSDEKRAFHKRRKYTLADARQDARFAAARLREAYEILDPMNGGQNEEAKTIRPERE
jgi:hypothetical protein